ncbi:MAG: chemotaxis protein CheB [Desulfobacteraceae bacterium]|jgi:two-component system, chemotaxis family, protein-glutamate methylesterase/glutaminase
MILFCEECGTRNDIDQKQITGNTYNFSCQVCREALVVSLVDKSKGKTVQAALESQGASPDDHSVDPLKVLVVDDSRIIRRVLCDIINSDESKTVVGEAAHGKEALEKLRECKPDVITLDINMPVMDGLTTLKHIMIGNPTPTVMISALTQEGASETFDSLKYGAIDFLPKPSQVRGGDLKSQQEEILRKIDLVAQVQIESVRYLRRASKEKTPDNGAEEINACQCVLVLGASEGGYGALLNVIPRLRKELPAAYVAVMQQAPNHLDAFARYLNDCSKINVQRAVDGTMLQGGTCYILASTEQLSLEQDQNNLKLKVVTTVSGSNGNGTIDGIMAEAARLLHENAAGVILTGKCDDGLQGLGEIINNGGSAFIQDPRSCLFKETPMAAANMYDVEFLVSDKQLAGAITAYVKSHTR